MRRQIVKIQEWVEEKLRLLCGRITPEKRLAVLLVMFALFAISSVYMIASGIYQIGKNEGQKIEIEHIKQLQLRTPKDSINRLNYFENGK